MKSRAKTLLVIMLTTLPFWGYAAPEYNIQPVSISCDALTHDEAYDTNYLKANYKLVEGKDGWIFVTSKDLRASFGLRGNTDTPLKSFIDALDQVGVEVILLYTPTRGIMHAEQVINWDQEYQTALENYYQTQAYFEQIGITTVDWKALKGQQEKDFFFKRDIHWTPEGARSSAKLAAMQLEKMGLADKSSADKFATFYSGVGGVKGTQRAVELICNTKLAEQSVIVYETAKTASNDEASLFGDTEVPQVALVGTSFSANTKYNFKGFIEQYSNTEVLNFAVGGGGKTGGWIDLLTSDYFQQTPPQAVIWEIPGYHNIIGSEELLGLVPLIHNGCANQEKFLSSVIKEFSAGGVHKEALFSIGESGVRSGDLVLDITLSNKNANALEATIWI